MEIPKLLTTNKIKTEEAKSIIPSIDAISFDRPEIQSPDPRVVVRAKLDEASELEVEGPIVVEDTALEIDQWKGLPGAFVKWFVESWGAGGLAREINKDDNIAGAEAVSAVGVLDRGEIGVWTGTLRGEIVPPRGQLGGWTPIFEVAGTGHTLAEMGYCERLSVTMRRAPLEKARYWLVQRGRLASDPPRMRHA